MEEEYGRSRHSQEIKTGKGKIIILGIIGFIIILVILAILWYNISLTGTGTSDEEVTVEIAMGSGTSKIAKVLKENDVIRSVEAFKIYVKLNNVNNFQAGSYNLTKDMSVAEIVETLKTGKVFKEANTKITFVEGKTVPYYARAIAEKTNNTEEDVYDLVKDEEYLDGLIDEYWFITDEIKNKYIYYALEGYLFPDTYSFEDENVTVKEIFKALLDEMEKKLEEYKADLQESKYTVHEILSIASIIENEAIFDADRKDVASVIYNRLNTKMSIGSDVTTYYAVKLELGTRDLYKSEINKENPYNTRGPNMAGRIPVGPICSPGKSSIEAALYPNDTDYLFFVADSSGKIYFTKTNAEHEKIINELKANNAWIQFE